MAMARFLQKMRDDHVLMWTTIIMALVPILAAAFFLYWAFALVPAVPPHPCAPDQGIVEGAIAWITSL